MTTEIGHLGFWRCRSCALSDPFGEYHDGWCQACWNAVAGRSGTTDVLTFLSNNSEESPRGKR